MFEDSARSVINRWRVRLINPAWKGEERDVILNFKIRWTFVPWLFTGSRLERPYCATWCVTSLV